MKVRFYAFLFLLAASLTSVAQDIHFSQFYAAPLTLNPALTGNFNGLYRVSGIYRNQWPGMTTSKPAFSTPSVSVDFSLLREKIKNGSLGVGVVFVNDQQNGKTFNINHILGSVAYNMGFGPEGKFQLGLGLQGGVITNKVDFTRLRFADGFDPNTLDYNQSSESLGKGKIRGQFNVGLFTKYDFMKTGRVYAGYSFNNLTRYKQDYVLNSIEKFNTPFRHTVHGGFEFDIKDKAVLIPGALYQNQAKAQETNFGLTAGIHVVRDPAKRATLFVGLWNRLNKANYTLIPKIGFEYKGFRAGFAYDAALGKQMSDSRNIGGPYAQAFEVTLSYIGIVKVPKEHMYLFNPRY